MTVEVRKQLPALPFSPDPPRRMFIPCIYGQQRNEKRPARASLYLSFRYLNPFISPIITARKMSVTPMMEIFCLTPRNLIPGRRHTLFTESQTFQISPSCPIGTWLHKPPWAEMKDQRLKLRFSHCCRSLRQRYCR